MTQRWETHENVVAAYQAAQEDADMVGGWDDIPAASPDQMDRYDSEVVVDMANRPFHHEYVEQQAAAFVAEKE